MWLNKSHTHTDILLYSLINKSDLTRQTYACIYRIGVPSLSGTRGGDGQAVAHYRFRCDATNHAWLWSQSALLWWEWHTKLHATFFSFFFLFCFNSYDNTSPLSSIYPTLQSQTWLSDLLYQRNLCPPGVSTTRLFNLCVSLDTTLGFCILC